ncbi:MAG: thioesterase [Bacteroidales bacterium]|nr:thioesterase [Bacteroidales bacterium]
MIYQFDFTIPNYLCDNHDTLNMWGCARLMQQGADDHTKLFGIGFSQLIQDHKAWVLCRTFYDVRRLPKEYERVTVRTWSRGTDGLYAWRDFEMLDEQGNLLVACATSWVILDTEARHVLRLGELIEGFEHHPQQATDKDKLGRIRMPRGAEPQLIVEHQPVLLSMIDHTQHVNNAEYVKWVFDHLPEGASTQAPFRLDVEYIRETHPGDAVSIAHHYQADNNTHYFRIDNSQSTAVIVTLNY